MQQTDNQTRRSRANRAARLARSLAMQSQGKSGGVATLVFVAVLLGWLGLTGYGTFLDSRPTGFGNALADALYGPFTFLTPQEGYRTAAIKLPNDALRIGRFFGAALPVLTILWAALHVSRASIARRLMRHFAAGHVVIVGRHGFADDLARQSAIGGASVALLEIDMTPGRAADLARAGVVVIPEAASFAGWLGHARARQAAHVVAWSAEDSVSLADALASADALQGGAHNEIVVHVETPETQRALRHAPALLESDAVRLRPLSPSFAALRRALGGAALVEDALAMGRGQVCVQLHGSSVALQIAATLVLRHGWSIHLGPPQVGYVADEAEWAVWRRHQASFLVHAAAVFDGDAPGFGAARRDQPVTRHIVDLGDDDRTLALAFDLASRLAQESEAPPRVQPVLRNAHAAHGLIAQADALRFAEPILLDRSRSLDALLARDEDAAAAALHLDYVARFGGAGLAAGAPWQALAETYVHASRAAADHASVKRHDIARARASGMEEEAMIVRMAETEHRRWSAERLLDGWAPGARDNGRRLHDNLVPWSELGPVERAKDRAQVMQALAGAG